MPFDEQDFIDLSKPSLKGLAFVLRHTAQWPENFAWDFGIELEDDADSIAMMFDDGDLPPPSELRRAEKFERCGSVGCAVGMAWLLWPETKDSPYIDMAKVFGLDETAMFAIFYRAQTYGHNNDDVSAVKPEHVADKIDLYLQEGSDAIR